LYCANGNCINFTVHPILKLLKYSIIFFLLLVTQLHVFAQQITGYWHGKIGGGLKGKKMDLKLVIKGDSIVGTSYYYESKNNYRRYSVKGYFNPRTNAVIWWDDVLIESKLPKVKIFSPSEREMLSEADFNCPPMGGGTMTLEGKSNERGKEQPEKNNLFLKKTNTSAFNDEWNYVIDNWMDGGNDVALIDSIQQIAFTEPVKPQPIAIQETISNNPVTESVVVLDLPVKKEVKELPKEKPVVQDNKPIEFLDINKPNIKKEVVQEKNKEVKDVLVLDTTKPFASNVGNNGVVFSDNFKTIFADTTQKIVPDEKPIVQRNTPIEFLDINKPNIKKEVVQEKNKEVKEVLVLDTVKSFTSKMDNKEVVLLDNNKKTLLDTAKIVMPVIVQAKPIELQFIKREKKVLTELPYADSIVLNFYDNAEVDGDSISLFLNDKLLLEHIRLTDKPFVVTLSKEQLATATELTMVAENLGAIPPNTSYMVAYINGKKYDATLSSTEQTSAVIRFSKPK
jgi:hypothetical protein